MLNAHSDKYELLLQQVSHNTANIANIFATLLFNKLACNIKYTFYPEVKNHNCYYCTEDDSENPFDSLLGEDIHNLEMCMIRLSRVLLYPVDSLRRYMAAFNPMYSPGNESLYSMDCDDSILIFYNNSMDEFRNIRNLTIDDDFHVNLDETELKSTYLSYLHKGAQRLMRELFQHTTYCISINNYEKISNCNSMIFQLEKKYWNFIQILQGEHDDNIDTYIKYYSVIEYALKNIISHGDYPVQQGCYFSI